MKVFIIVLKIIENINNLVKYILVKKNLISKFNNLKKLDIETPLEHYMLIQAKTFCEEILNLIMKKLVFKIHFCKVV